MARKKGSQKVTFEPEQIAEVTEDIVKQLKRPRGRPTMYDPTWMKSCVIDMGSEGASKAEMAAELGISKDTFHEWVKKHEDFAESVKEATLLSQVWWEKNGRRAIFNSQGFNVTGWIFQMKNRFGDDWRDVKQTELSGPNGGPIETKTEARFNVEAMDIEELDVLEALLIKGLQPESSSDDDEGED